MSKNLLLLIITTPSILFSTVNNNFGTKSSIQIQIQANNHITGNTFHGIPLVSLSISAGLFCLSADRLSRGDHLGAAGSALVGFAALDYSYNLYKTDKQVEKERLDQNERLINKEIEQEKKERSNQNIL
jgi:hypothetical protein